MPLEDTSPKSPIDELYKKYAAGTHDYPTLRAELEKINYSILNQDANILYDSSNVSYAAANRRDKELIGVPKTFDKERLYGIVLYKTGKYNKEVYIDVPTKTTPIIDPDVFYTNPDLDLKIYRQYLFEPSSLDYYSTPVVGGIAVVKVPKNFPNHINSNPEDAVYLHMKRPDILISIKDSGEKARPPLAAGGGILIMNSGGDATVPADAGSIGDSAEEEGVSPGGCDDPAKEKVLEGKNILLIGDSHTVGHYGINLERLFKDAKANVTKIAEEGKAAAYYSTGAGSSLITGKNAHIVIFTIGTNDIADSRFAKSSDYKAIIKNIESVFSKTGVKSENRYWVGVPSFSDNAAKTYAGNASLKIKDLNKRATELWNSYGITEKIDPREVTRPHVQPTDIHFQETGGKAWAEFVFAKVKDLEAKKIICIPPKEATVPSTGPATSSTGTPPATGKRFETPSGKSSAPQELDSRLEVQQNVGFFRGTAHTITIKKISSAYTDIARYLQPDAADQINLLMRAWGEYSNKNKIKYYVKIISGFRTNKGQTEEYNKWISRGQPTRAAPPGRSNHQYGLAVDFIGTDPAGNNSGSAWITGKGIFYDWLKQNAPKYGFKRTVPSEHWHWEFRYSWINPAGGNINDPMPVPKTWKVNRKGKRVPDTYTSNSYIDGELGRILNP